MSSFLINTRINNLEKEASTYLSRSEFNSFLETELGTDLNANIQTIAQLSNTSSYLTTTTNSLKTLISTETQLDDAVYTNYS
jgi:hypothetical protein